jgi:glycosyltransferase involved in cell wall biosynthesis
VRSNEAARFHNPTQLIYCWYDDVGFVPADTPQRNAARVALGLQPADVVITTVGNCAPAKNHEAVLLALTRLADTIPLRYLHAGLEPADGQERRLAHELGIQERVTFLGHVADVPQLLQASDCFVMPSRYEGMGIAALEAIALGVPAVLADVPGLSDLRRYFPEAAWVEPEPDAIAEAIGQLLAEPEEDRRRTARFAAERAAATFGPGALVPQLVSVYRTDEHRRPGGRRVTPLARLRSDRRRRPRRVEAG